MHLRVYILQEYRYAFLRVQEVEVQAWGKETNTDEALHEQHLQREWSVGYF